MRVWWWGGGVRGEIIKVPFFIQREKKSSFWNQNSHLCNLFTIHHTFSTEGRGWTLWSYEETNAALCYTGFAFFSEWGKSGGLSLLLVHLHCPSTAVILGRAGGWVAQMEGTDKVASLSFKSKSCFRSGRLTKRTKMGVHRRILYPGLPLEEGRAYGSSFLSVNPESYRLEVEVRKVEDGCNKQASEVSPNASTTTTLSLGGIWRANA